MCTVGGGIMCWCLQSGQQFCKRLTSRQKDAVRINFILSSSAWWILAIIRPPMYDQK